MKYRFLYLLSTFFIGACATAPKLEYASVPLTPNALKQSQWQALDRFPARYPVQAVKRSLQGCVTLEYVITPSYAVKDIKVIASSSMAFERSAQNVIKAWDWSQLPEGIITQPLKTQTRFEYCLNEPDAPCDTDTIKSVCPGDDIIMSAGSIIKRANIT